LPDDSEAIELPFWQEALFGIEVLLLHATPVYYGIGVPRGDESAVVMIPGFLASDIYLLEMYAWLRRIGYRPYYSGIGLNADCPNLLIRSRLNQTIDRARKETGAKIHILGHSLGGLLARSVAAERADEVSSVVTLGSPFRGTVLHPTVKQAVDAVRKRILLTQGDAVLPTCYTGKCTCNFLNSLRRDLPESVHETAIYTKMDGFVDWHYCITGDPGKDIEVNGTHVGLAFNPVVYGIIAERLGLARQNR
jgi:pimeloyl-ACP methyl ester carboxylesterase